MQILRIILLGPPTQPAIDTTCEGANSDFTSSNGLCKQKKNGPLAPSSEGIVAMKKCGHPMCYFSVTGRKCLLAEEQREEDKLQLLSAVRFLRKAHTVFDSMDIALCVPCFLFQIFLLILILMVGFHVLLCSAAECKSY